ncbi:MAG: hypothetical protein ACJAYG_002739 [Oceanicoccus sp.]|jgi:hypothetical protein
MPRIAKINTAHINIADAIRFALLVNIDSGGH